MARPARPLRRDVAVKTFIMTNQVVAFQVDTPGRRGPRRLEWAHMPGAPVPDQAQVLGVVTVRDLIGPGDRQPAGRADPRRWSYRLPLKTR